MIAIKSTDAPTDVATRAQLNRRRQSRYRATCPSCKGRIEAGHWVVPTDPDARAATLEARGLPARPRAASRPRQRRRRRRLGRPRTGVREPARADGVAPTSWPSWSRRRPSVSRSRWATANRSRSRGSPTRRSRRSSTCWRRGNRDHPRRPIMATTTARRRQPQAL